MTCATYTNLFVLNRYQFCRLAGLRYFQTMDFRLHTNHNLLTSSANRPNPRGDYRIKRREISRLVPPS
ncbi:hypothetical protein CW304_00475 [Bacillus sp. UFRGS-B20]|nr:hypothetical protein CW304_00475 [Bacillus sp. UFRGS-B20]